MNIVIIGLIVLSVIAATIGFSMSLGYHQVEQPIRADFIVITFLLLAIFLLLLAITLKMY